MEIIETKKYLFLSNSNKPSSEKHNSLENVNLGNVRIPSIEAAISLGYEIYVGVNRINADKLKPSSNHDVKFYNQNIFRSIFDV